MEQQKAYTQIQLIKRQDDKEQKTYDNKLLK